MDDKEKLKLERLNARYKRQNEAMREKYDRVSATLPKGTIDRIKALNLTVNGLINDLVLAELERLEMGTEDGKEATQSAEREPETATAHKSTNEPEKPEIKANKKPQQDTRTEVEKLAELQVIIDAKRAEQEEQKQKEAAEDNGTK